MKIINHADRDYFLKALIANFVLYKSIEKTKGNLKILPAHLQEIVFKLPYG